MIFLKLGDGPTVKGDCNKPKHKDWIQCNSMLLSSGRPLGVAEGKDRGAGDSYVSEITISKKSDCASSDLFMQACSGASVGKKSLIHFWQAGDPNKNKDGIVFLAYELSDVIVTKWTNHSADGNNPSETITLNFTKIARKYDQWVDGSKVADGDEKKWDVADKVVWS